MNKKNIVSLIQECIKEVIEEDFSTDSAKKREREEYTDYLNAKRQSIDAEISSTKNGDELDEMARIPTLFKALDADPAEIEALPKHLKAIYSYLKTNPDQTKLQIAAGMGKSAQQAVNMLLNDLVNRGLIEPTGLKSEPKYKNQPQGDGTRGRKLTHAGKLKRAAQSVYDKVKSGREDEISFEEAEILGDANIQKIKDTLSSKPSSIVNKPVKPTSSDIEPTADDLEDIDDMDINLDDFNGDDEFGGLFENEEFQKGDYNRALEVIRYYEDNVILEDFKNTFPKGQPINKEDFFEFCERYYDDMSELEYTKKNWEYILTGNEDVFNDNDLYEIKKKSKSLNESIKNRWQKLANIKG